MPTARQRCFRVDRLARELYQELRIHASNDKDFRGARTNAKKTLESVEKVCAKKTSWEAVTGTPRAWSRKRPRKRKRKKRKR